MTGQLLGMKHTLVTHSLAGPATGQRLMLYLAQGPLGGGTIVAVAEVGLVGLMLTAGDLQASCVWAATAMLCDCHTSCPLQVERKQAPGCWGSECSTHPATGVTKSSELETGDLEPSGSVPTTLTSYCRKCGRSKVCGNCSCFRTRDTTDLNCSPPESLWPGR